MPSCFSIESHPMKRSFFHPCALSLACFASTVLAPAFSARMAGAQDSSRPVASAANPTSSPLPAPLGVPKPGPTNEAPYAPQPILPGGVVIPLYPPDSPQLNTPRLREAEQYNMSKAVPGRISSIVNIHNPSIEVH